MKRIILDEHCNPILKERKGLEKHEFAIINNAKYVVDPRQSKLKLKPDGSLEMKVICRIPDADIPNSVQRGPSGSIDFERCGIFNINCEDDFFSAVENNMSIIFPKLSSPERVVLQSTLRTKGEPKGEHGGPFVDKITEIAGQVILAIVSLGLFSIFLIKKRNMTK